VTTEFTFFESNGVMYAKPKYDMADPVRCSFCGEVYSLLSVGEIISRHADCTAYMTPCCNRLASDTGHTTDFKRL
jgi:hypothetical protein